MYKDLFCLCRRIRYVCTADVRITRAVCIFNRSFVDAGLRELDWPEKARERTEYSVYVQNARLCYSCVVMVADDRRYQEFSFPATLEQITHHANIIKMIIAIKIGLYAV